MFDISSSVSVGNIEVLTTDNKGHSIEEVAQMEDVNSERIRQIEAKALRKLRHPT